VQQETGGKQTPVGQPLNVKGHDLGQFFFHLKKDEARDWAATRQENTLAGYERFLLAYPTGANAEEARTTVAFLQEETAWKQAQNANTIAAYDRYLQQYRQGRYSRLAIDAQKTLEETAAWNRATQRNTISAYRDFQYNYAESKYYNEAEERIQQLQTPVQPPVQREPEQKLGSEYYVGGGVVDKQTPISKPAPKKEPAVKSQKQVAAPAAKSSISIVLSTLGTILLFVIIIWKPWRMLETSKQQPVKGISVDIFNENNRYHFLKRADTTTIPAYEDFLQKYPKGNFADSARLEIRKMELKVLNYFKDAQALWSGAHYKDAVIELDAAAKLGSTNPFISKAIRVLKSGNDTESGEMILAGIRLQNEKLK